MEEKGGLNLYGFVNNNPYSYYDPDGRNPGAVVGVIGGIGAVEIAAGIMGISAAACIANSECRALAASIGKEVGKEIVKELVRPFEFIINKCRKKNKCLPCKPPAGTKIYEIAPPGSRSRGRHSQPGHDTGHGSV